MRWVALSICAGCASCVAPKGQPGTPGDVTAIVSFDDIPIGLGLAVSDYDGVRSISADAHGTITFRVTPPASVTVTSATSLYAMTFTGIEPGDLICFPCPAQAPTAPTTIAVAPRSDAASYTFGNGEEIHFDAAQPSVEMYAGGGVHDVLAVANDGAGAPIAYTAAPGQTLAGGTLTLPSDWHPIDTFTADFDGLPATPVEMHLLRAESSAANRPAAYGFQYTIASTTGSHASVQVPTASFGGLSMTVVAELWADGYDQLDAWRAILPVASSVHVDVPTELLPWIAGVAIDRDARAVSWSYSRAPHDADGVRVILEWVDAAGITRQWTLYAAPDATSVAFPELPDGSQLPATFDADVELDDFRAPHGYAELRSSTEHGDDSRFRFSSGRGHLRP
ncbi:MAG TPA: hypothetical protein VL463_34360 [Kofleriaceae bacterium]|nr:hypothetical protein [Kofleriaceae bacterium]